MEGLAPTAVPISGVHTSELGERGCVCSTSGKRSSSRSSVLEDAGPQRGHLMPWLCCDLRRMELRVLLVPPSHGPSYRHWQGVPCGPGLLRGHVETGRVHTCVRAGSLVSPRARLPRSASVQEASLVPGFNVRFVEWR